ncbi:MAG: LemA family protein, partial [Solirubrobacterales bacterium]
KANQNFLQLQNELTDTEDKIQASRRFYNMNVRDLNTKIQQFPSSIIAGFAHITEHEFFEIENEEEKNVPSVSFDTPPAVGGAPAAAPAAPAPAAPEAAPPATEPPSGGGESTPPGPPTA